MAEDGARTHRSKSLIAAGNVVGGRYLILEFLGAGGIGDVCRARDQLLSREVAIKVIAPPPGGDRDWAVGAIRELRAASELSHPHILPIFETVNDADGSLIVVERLVHGTDLQTVLRREGPLPPQRVVEVVSAVASALDAAHTMGLVHRDLKPANILVDTSRVFLADFGIASLANDRPGPLERPIGTPEYMAPEQIAGRPVNPQTDLYALGAVLFTLLTGQPPFHRDTATATLYAHLYTPPPRASALRPDLPEEIDAVVAKALAKTEAERFSTASELAQAMRAALTSGHPHPVDPVSFLPSLVSLSESSHGDDASQGPPDASAPTARLRRSLPQAFTDGVGGIFDIFHGIRRHNWRPVTFEDSLAGDARELCRELGLAIQSANGFSDEADQ